jgi:transposase
MRLSSGIRNRGYRKYLTRQGEHFVIDEQVVRREARYDGKWVLRTNTDLSAAEVALKYKQLWMVEDLFRTSKSFLATRPIFHRCDETIRGHVFCSFLALILRKELQARLEARGESLEWDDIVRDLDALTETEVLHEGKRIRLRAEAQGTCGKVFQAVGVALPPTVRRLEDTAQA